MPQAAPAEHNLFLAQVDAADLRVIEPGLREVVLKLGSILCEPDDPIEYVYFPTSGMVSIVMVLGGGQRVETGIVGRDGIVGSAVTGIERSNDQAMVQVAGEALRLPSTIFLAVYDQSKRFRGLVNRYNATLWELAAQCAVCNAVHILEARLARWLLQTRDKIGTKEVPLTHEFLSLMLGVQRTSVTISAGNLQKLGLIANKRGRIEILDPDELAKRTCEWYHLLKKRAARNSSIA